MMKYDIKLKECISYFKNSRGFDRVFNKIRENYLSLGRIGGTIRITSLNEEEKNSLSTLLRKNYYDKNSATINANKIKEALDKYTRFNDLNFEDILFGYFDCELIPKKEIRRIQIENKMKYFKEIIKDFRNTPAEDWVIEALTEKNSLYLLLTRRYEYNKCELRKDLYIVMRAYNLLVEYSKTNRKDRLPIFASKVTKNPHAFDEDSSLTPLLINGICDILKESLPKNAEEKSLLYYKAGVIKDELSNYTTCYGITGFKQGDVHFIWQVFKESKEPFNASVWNINTIDRATAPNKTLYIFENPGVFAEILEEFKDKEIGLMCTYGQVRYSSLILLDMLAEEGTTFYYNGDYDPEGLRIADKLKSRYGEKFKCWRYDYESYGSIISRKEISAKSLAQIPAIKDKQLKELGESIKKHKYAGYQELLIDTLIEDIKKAGYS